MAGMAMKENWTPTDAPRLDGKVAIVTGATGGLGYATALGLARQGATTVVSGRNVGKGAAAVERIRHDVSTASVRFEPLDLASLASIAQFAASTGRVDILVNNAGVMGLPSRRLTQDGFEQQIGVNFLGHFALTARLKDVLCAASGGGRVVNVASLAHRRGVLNLDDLQSEQSYTPMGAYARSKLAMLMFTLELQRRANQNRWNLVSVAAHPGWARTDIVNNGIGDGAPGVKAWLIDHAFGLAAQSARNGALPSLYAAMAPEAMGGGYYGPTRFGETRGSPGVSRIFPQAENPVDGRRLWALSEKLTGVTF